MARSEPENGIDFMPGRLMSGIPASPGRAFGDVFILDQEGLPAHESGRRVSQPDRELEHWRQVVQTCRRELELLQEKGVGSEAAAEIIMLQVLLLDDPEFGGAAEELIGEGLPAEDALLRVLRHQEEAFSRLEDPLLRSRLGDIIDLARRIHRHLSGGRDLAVHIPRGAVLAARELFPSQTVGLGKAGVAGIVTERGSITSHAAILARGLGIPAVVGIEGLLEGLARASIMALDGTTGQVWLDPGDEFMDHFIDEPPAGSGLETLSAADPVDAPSEAATAPATIVHTQDGVEIALLANLGHPDQANAARRAGAAGVGLLRTEFMFLGRTLPPGEDEQTELYRKALVEMAPLPVTIRTLDGGADKPLAYLKTPEEDNPALGLRGIRLSLAFPDVLRTQLRALVRAAIVSGNLRIMLPMVVETRELQQVREMLEEVRQALEGEIGCPVPRPPLGVMIETPAAALTAAMLARHANFFSIGSNDLAQYVMAADRQNSRVAGYCSPFHPAHLRCLQMTARAARRRGITCAICGEVAGMPDFLPLLVGYGITRLSMNPAAFAGIREMAARIDSRRARDMAAKALKRTGAGEVETLVRKLLAT